MFKFIPHLCNHISSYLDDDDDDFEFDPYRFFATSTPSARGKSSEVITTQIKTTAERRTSLAILQIIC